MRKAASPQFMTLEELVEYAGINKRTIYGLLRQGLISVHRIGPDVRFCKSEVDQLIAKRKKKNSPSPRGSGGWADRTIEPKEKPIQALGGRKDLRYREVPWLVKPNMACRV